MLHCTLYVALHSPCCISLSMSRQCKSPQATAPHNECRAPHNECRAPHNECRAPHKSLGLDNVELLITATVVECTAQGHAFTHTYHNFGSCSHNTSFNYVPPKNVAVMILCVCVHVCGCVCARACACVRVCVCACVQN